MPALAPLKLTLYNLETYEVLGDYVCNFIPVRYLKLAIRLSKSLININADTLAGLIVDLFGNKFSVDDLQKYSEQRDRMTVLQAVMTRSGNFMLKPSETGSAGETGNTSTESEDEYWLEDLEISLVNSFGWSLQEIDNTDIESLFPFIMRYAHTGGEPVVKQGIFCDQVSWL
jgi:hypothetical protein